MGPYISILYGELFMDLYGLDRLLMDGRIYHSNGRHYNNRKMASLGWFSLQHRQHWSLNELTVCCSRGKIVRQMVLAMLTGLPLTRLAFQGAARRAGRASLASFTPPSAWILKACCQPVAPRWHWLLSQLTFSLQSEGRWLCCRNRQVFEAPANKLTSNIHTHRK